MDDKGQISAEFLVLFAAVLALATLVVTHLYSTGKSFTKSSAESTDKAMKVVKKLNGGK